jgi:cytochrome c556
MKGARTLAGVALGVALAAPVGGQSKANPYRNYTQEKFEENMQAAGRNYAAVSALLTAADYEAAKAQLTRAREQLAITVTFWRDHQKTDAVGMLRTAVASLDNLDVALSASPIDPAAVRGAAQKADAACAACHSVYRDQDPATKAYRLKPGAVQ